MDRQTNIEIMKLQKKAVDEKAQEEAKALETKVLYEYKKAEEEMLARQFLIDKQYMEESAPVRQLGLQLESNMAAHGMMVGQGIPVSSPPPRVRPTSRGALGLRSGTSTPQFLQSRFTTPQLPSRPPPTVGTPGSPS